MIRLILTLSALALLATCDSPSPKLRGATATIIDIDQSRLRVFHSPGQSYVEAHRISPELRSSRILTFEKAYRAIEQATGCKIREGTLAGDQAIVTAEVDC